MVLPYIVLPYSITFMDKYKIKSYRVDERTHQSLLELKKEKGISWNRLFYRLLKLYESQGSKDDVSKV